MRATDFETITPDAPLTGLPLTLRQTPSRAAPFLLAALAMPAALVSLVPFVLVAEHLSRDSTILITRIETALAIGAGLLLWIGVFAWPFLARVGRAGCDRTIEITGTMVTVTDQGWLAAQTWQEPLSAYTGLSHRVRSSLSGTRHELLLMHVNSSRTLLLRVAPRIAQSELDETAMLLGCREIAPRVIYPTFGYAPAVRSPDLASAA
jgi:hypothetical protein